RVKYSAPQGAVHPDHGFQVQVNWITHTPGAPRVVSRAVVVLGEHLSDPTGYFTVQLQANAAPQSIADRLSTTRPHPPRHIPTEWERIERVQVEPCANAAPGFEFWIDSITLFSLPDVLQTPQLEPAHPAVDLPAAIPIPPERQAAPLMQLPAALGAAF
ncbi:MAG: hypothetical protein JW937_05685, partial [Candidatus Omnitrophica bacterium]|nr:hypothetical protein [Candidatus Omnitrophota bacterium]